MNKKNLMFIMSSLVILFARENNSYAMDGNKEENVDSIKKQTLDNKGQGLLISIENVPVEIFWEVCYKLLPRDIIRLTLVSQSFKGKINGDFWESHIRRFNQKKWDLSVNAVKVAFAFSLFEEGKMEEAEKLGYPKHEIIKKQEDDEKERIQREWNRAKIKAKMQERGMIPRRDNFLPRGRSVFDQKLNPSEFDY